MYSLGNQAGQNEWRDQEAQFPYFHGPLAATGVYQYVNVIETTANGFALW
jgi:hypothetical protein